MKERPILFSGSMVRAILAGAKTQTRRVMKPQPEMVAFAGEPVPAFSRKLCAPGFEAVGVSVFNKPGNQGLVKCPYGMTGDRLWVRETWRMAQWGTPIYRADAKQSLGMDEYSDRHKWKPSIFMPRSASRLTLEITDVRVERIQQIDAGGAVAEGITIDNRQLRETPNFRELWDSINAKRGFGWDANPWVWVISFKRLP